MTGSPEMVYRSYGNPPVVETVFAVSLRPLPLNVVDLSLFGDSQLGDLPVRQEQPPMPTTVETFDGPVPNLAPTISLLEGPPPIRLWFQSEDRSQLVQIQRDWLACNWQGLSNVPYPRYNSTEDFFLGVWDKLDTFVAEERSGDLAAVQCELSYINHIVPGDLWERRGQIDSVLRLAGTADSFLPEPEDAQFAYRYRIPYEGQDVARLYVQAAPGAKADGTPVIQLNMIARGAPIGEGREGLVRFFRLAHEWIVEGFAAVTTERAQSDLWKRDS